MRLILKEVQKSTGGKTRTGHLGRKSSLGMLDDPDTVMPPLEACYGKNEFRGPWGDRTRNLRVISTTL